jgi:hypothetical protein
MPVTEHQTRKIIIILLLPNLHSNNIFNFLSRCKLNKLLLITTGKGELNGVDGGQ